MDACIIESVLRLCVATRKAAEQLEYGICVLAGSLVSEASSAGSDGTDGLTDAEDRCVGDAWWHGLKWW